MDLDLIRESIQLSSHAGLMQVRLGHLGLDGGSTQKEREVLHLYMTILLPARNISRTGHDLSAAVLRVVGMRLSITTMRPTRF